MAAMGEDDELSDLKARLKDMVDGGLPVTRERITAVAECGVRNVTKYKKVVYMVERFIRHADDRFRSAGICVIDALCTKSRKTLGKEKDVYTPRFAVRMKETVATLQSIPRADKALLDRIFNEWRKRGWFNVAPLSDPSSTSAKGASSSSSSAHAHRPSSAGQKRTAPEPSTGQGDSGAAELKRELSTASTGSTGRPEDPRKRSTPKDPRKRSRTSSTGSNGGGNVSSPIVAPLEELVRTASTGSSFEGSVGGQGHQGGGGGGGGGQLIGGSGGVSSGHVHTSEREAVRDPRSSRSRRHSDTDRPTGTATHSHTATLTSSHAYAHETRAHGHDNTYTRTRETYTHKQETHTDAHTKEHGRAHTHVRVSSSSSSAVAVSGGGHASSQGATVGGMHSPDRRSFGGVLLSDLEDDEEEEDEPLDAMDTALPSTTTTPTHTLTPLTPQLQQQPSAQIPAGTPRQQPQQQITHAAMPAVAMAQAPVDDTPAPQLWSTPDDKALQRAKELMALVRDGVNNGNTSNYWPVDDPLYSPASTADVVMMQRDIAMDGTEAHPHRFMMDMDVVGPPLTVVTGPSGFFVSHRQVRMENPATITPKPPSSTPVSPVVKKPVVSRWGKSVGLGAGGTGSSTK